MTSAWYHNVIEKTLLADIGIKGMADQISFHSFGVTSKIAIDTIGFEVGLQRELP
jgi:hypothetical protein